MLFIKLLHILPLLTISVPPSPYNLLTGNNDLSNDILIPNVAPLKDIKGVETGDKGELSYRKLIKAFKSYGKWTGKSFTL